MSRVLTIDDDLADRIEQEVSTPGEPLHETVTRLLRSSLDHLPRPASGESFRAGEAKALGIPEEWTSGKVEDLLDILEGPGRRW